MNVRRSAVTIATVLACAPFAGCTGGEPSKASPTSRATASETPTPTLPTPGTGAKDVLLRWLDEWALMQVTGNTDNFLALSMDSCAYCADFAKEVSTIYEAGGHVTFPDPSFTQVKRQKIQARKIFRQYHVDVASAPSQVVRRKGAAPEEFSGEPQTLEISLRHTSDGWRVQALNRPGPQ